MRLLCRSSPEVAGIPQPATAFGLTGGVPPPAPQAKEAPKPRYALARAFFARGLGAWGIGGVAPDVSEAVR